MEINLLNLRKSINKAYLKVKPNRTQIETFKKNIINLFDQIKESESEEFHKNIISEFLKNTYYSPGNYINTKGRSDLVVHNGKDSKSSVGVLFEVKKPGNKPEMPTETNINTKAFHELILYYLRERVSDKNIEVKHLVITNIFEWFIFNASDFERLFANDKAFIKQFTDFEEGRLAGTNTDFFYKNIAEPFVSSLESEISVTHFNIRDFETIIKNADREDDTKLIALYKIFSPEHLLKLPFANDSNNLDKAFYNELLHIIGLEETKEGSKKVIGRKIEKKRNPGSLIENSITIIKSEDCLSQVSKLSDYGDNQDDQLFNIALELAITWINRILFLKLLEGQLVKYNNGDKSFRFLNIERIHDYDELNKLFFQVLAVKESDRGELIKQKFGSIPYLNSSLFEPGDLEHKTIRISNLDDHFKLPVLAGTVLKDKTGKKLTGETDPLKYLFDFLDSYDFSSEGSEDIQEENKTLINASVLGLIFEKINGYKDGSFFTPGFITMYMCHETIRRAVVQKFNETKNWKCETISDVYNKIEDIKDANRIVNSLRICDPAVGSGHFLVSALNEIIAIKSELKILTDSDGKKLKEYTIEVINDELIITDEQSKLFEYNPKSKESQRVQEALFQEKQKIIENCLFGVDINPNSVKICRLRLWIELLKNAYYKTSSPVAGCPTPVAVLETLPNIDINIKCGNSLISRYPLDADIKSALKSSKWNVDNYREAVMSYRNAQSKEEKLSFEQLISKIKNDFETEVSKSDKRFLKLNKLNGELLNLTSQTSLFELSKAQKEEWNKKVKKLTDEINRYDIEIKEIKSNKIYENAFEWRFEFPEVLNNDGDFVGFDVVIGNPPYLNFKMYSQAERDVFKSNFKEIFDGKADIYYFFFLLGLNIVKYNGILNYITSRYWLEAEFAEKLRRLLANKFSIKEIIDFKNVTIFDGIGIKTSSAIFQKTEPKNQDIFNYKFIDSKKIKSIELKDFTNISIYNDDIKTKSKWVFGDKSELIIYRKIETDTELLEDIADCKQGILSGYDKAFIVSKGNELGLPKENLKPWLKVGDVFRYYFNIREERKLIYPNEIEDISKFPEFTKHLKPFKERLENRVEVKMGNYRWYDLHRSRDSKLFDSPKLICRYKASQNTFALDNDKFYSSADTTIVVLKNEYKKEYNLKFILALVNSKLLDFYFKSYGKLMDYRFEYYPGPVGQLRIKKTKNQIDFVNIVDKIIEAKNIDQQADTSTLEADIDRLVYELYGLTEEEIRIVEGG